MAVWSPISFGRGTGMFISFFICMFLARVLAALPAQACTHDARWGDTHWQAYVLTPPATRGRGIGTEHPWWVAVTVVMAKGQSGQRQWLTVCVSRHEHSAASHDCGGCLRSACGSATCHATCTCTGDAKLLFSFTHAVVFLSPLLIYRKTDGLYAQGEILTVKSEAGQWYSGARLPRSLQQLVSALY